MDSLHPTETQLRILAMCAQGQSREEIGSELYLSPWTVKRYLDDLRELLGARNVTHAVALCVVQGFLEPDPISRQVLVADRRIAIAA